MDPRDHEPSGPPPDPTPLMPPTNGNSRAAAQRLLDALELEPEDVLAILWMANHMIERRQQGDCCRPG